MKNEIPTIVRKTAAPVAAASAVALNEEPKSTIQAELDDAFANIGNMKVTVTVTINGESFFWEVRKNQVADLKAKMDEVLGAEGASTIFQVVTVETPNLGSSTKKRSGECVSSWECSDSKGGSHSFLARTPRELDALLSSTRKVERVEKVVLY